MVDPGLLTFLNILGVSSAAVLVIAAERRTTVVGAMSTFVLVGSAWFGARLCGESGEFVRFASALVGWPILAFLGSRIRRLATFRAVGTPSKSDIWRDVKRTPDGELALAIESFLGAGDSGDVSVLRETYSDAFTCYRVADQGTIKIGKEEMFALWSRAAAGAHAIPTRETRVKFVDRFGESAFVVLTRSKQLSKAWETMFYVLAFRFVGGRWRLDREFVHQRSAPSM